MLLYSNICKMSVFLRWLHRFCPHWIKCYSFEVELFVSLDHLALYRYIRIFPDLHSLWKMTESPWEDNGDFSSTLECCTSGLTDWYKSNFLKWSITQSPSTAGTFLPWTFNKHRGLGDLVVEDWGKENIGYLILNLSAVESLAPCSNEPTLSLLSLLILA